MRRKTLSMALGFFLGGSVVCLASSFDLMDVSPDSWRIADSQTNPFNVDQPLDKPASEWSVTSEEKVGSNPRQNLDAGFWFRVCGGCDFFQMTEVIQTLKYLGQTAEAQEVQSTAAFTNYGLALECELGLDLDRDNGLSLSAENILPTTQSLFIVDGGSNFTESATSNLLDFCLNYYRYLSTDNGGKTSIIVGLGYYHAGLAYNGNINDSVHTSATASLGGDILGGTLGLEREWNLGSGFFLNIALKGRLAYFSQVTAPSVIQSGFSTAFVSYGGTGAYNLASYPGFGLILAQDSLFGNTQGLERVGVDYSGLNGRIGISCFF